MAIGARLIKRRIRSVQNTRKITGAMELVAASKMRRAADLTLASRAYAKTAGEIVTRARQDVDERIHPLLGGRRNPQASLVIIVASDRGLCGGFNVQLSKAAVNFLKERNETLVIATVGKRAAIAVRRAGLEITTVFESISNAPSFDHSAPVGAYAYDLFIKKTVDRVFVIYTDYRSALSQVPTVEQLLPIIPEAELANMSAHDEDDVWKDGGETGKALFEPSAEKIFDALLPRVLETKIYQSLLESAASEHAARMMAMKNATKNAGEMIESLQFTYNQARQAGITQEMLEITSGKSAIE